MLPQEVNNLIAAEDFMKIDIKTQDFPLTDALRSYAERRLHFALTCCEDRIQRVAMRLSDINGPRGGADKRCRLQVVLAGLPDVVVEDTEVDLYVAIDRATDRTGRTLVRKIERQQTLFRQGRQLVLDES
jgi:putative sigma-54 modulation protein